MKTENVGTIQNKNIIVLGLAKSGLAVAKLLVRLGANVTVNERQVRESCQGVEELEQLGISVICGSHPTELLEGNVSMIVKNPGIPFDIPFLQEAEKKGIPIVTEVEIAYLISEAPIIGITGSNGKTTTTTLIYEMLKESDREPIIAGNIGTVLSQVAETAQQDQWLVAELSSFQLLGTDQFRPRIATLLNVFDAHLDYHHTKEHYVFSKARLFANQRADDVAVLNYDHELTRGLADQLHSQIAWFSRKTDVSRGAFIQDGKIVSKDRQGNIVELVPLQELKLIGAHNVENALAAVSVALEAGAKIERIRHVLTTFEGVEHRLQFVREVEGVRYYNDSKATNSVATRKSVESFSVPVVLIAGGLDRGDDFHELEDLFRTRVKALVAYGQNSKKMLEVAKRIGVNQIISVDNVNEAVESAAQFAQTGDVVLLSPASASWDQFTSFEERGDMFTQSVHKLR
ncbi:UDP-N-acetylmuramoyl-L-alanine--D-glutamate ligase [Caldalkalibacillus mannanilyticus]|uniref:UDP-N-acetylmuramoyl-L-alanine--D-glutamate ligase n=1 Tax=Caldalkalibacillus mannanilyticus TaxID=1418 RepID=UPI000468CEF9|nr:UDP-N-acetylmuramoyl-L-alanine--D-glutamate ligase [Caldalkalibacillus mannanilyticus]